MVRHHGQLSGSEASQRQRVSVMLGGLRHVGSAYRSGLVGTDQIRRMSRVWSNPRVRAFMPTCEAEFLAAATAMEFPDFDSFCREWEQAVDADGAHKQAERRWQLRNVNTTQDFNGMWNLNGRMMSLDGAEFSEILSRSVHQQRLADIQVAKAEFGDEWRQHLPRTTAQLRYDSFMALIRHGAVAPPDGGSAEVVTNIVIDQESFEQQLAQLVGAEPEPVIPDEVAAAIIAGHRFSHTINGVWVNGAEVVTRSLTDKVRRAVINSSGVVINLGRTQRLFTGSSRLAAMLQSTRCYWHGCWNPATHCQIDHLTPFREHGTTNPENGWPACGGHNLTKEHGYRARHNPDGSITITRPDGTTIPDHTTHWQQPRDG